MSKSGDGEDGNVVDMVTRKPPAKRTRKAKAPAAEAAKRTAARSPQQQIDENKPTCGALLRPPNPDGERCAHGAGWGTKHPAWGRCKMHGGSSKAGVQHAARMFANHQRDMFKARAQFFGVKVNIGPEEALYEGLQLAAAAVKFIGDKLAAWNQDTVDAAELEALDPWPDTAEGRAGAAAVDGFSRGWESRHGGAEIEDAATGLPTLVAVYTTEKAVGFTDTEYAAWLKLYRAERRELMLCAKACIDVGISERIARVMEERGMMHRMILGYALEQLGAKAAPEVLQQVLQDATRKAIAESTSRSVG